MTISPLHIPEISNNVSPVLSFFMTPSIALYLPPTQPIKSAVNGFSSWSSRTFGLELYIGNQMLFGTSYIAMVTKLVFHLAEQYPTGVHVRLGKDTVGRKPIAPLLKSSRDENVLFFSPSTLAFAHQS